MFASLLLLAPITHAMENPKKTKKRIMCSEQDLTAEKWIAIPANQDNQKRRKWKFQCPLPFCQKIIFDRSRHAQGHTKQQQIQCVLCQKILLNPCTFKDHLKRMHSATDSSAQNVELTQEESNNLPDNNNSYTSSNLAELENEESYTMLQNLDFLNDFEFSN